MEEQYNNYIQNPVDYSLIGDNNELAHQFSSQDINELCKLHKIEPYILSVAVINLNSIAYNYINIKSELASSTVAGAVVKANSYGFGAIQVSKRLYKEGCRDFFVATIEEGIEIRSVLERDAKIYILGGILKGCESAIIENSLIPALNDVTQIDLWIEHSKTINKRLNAVIQVDTGMCRNGLSKEDVELNIDKIKKNINVEFVLSHLACADIVDHHMNVLQLNRYKEILKIFGDNTKGSFSATNGFFLGKEYQFDIVRPGKALYGFSIREDKIGSMMPVMNIFAKIIQVNDLPIGGTIGYGSTFVADRNMKTVTIGMGYADGFMRKFAGFGHGFIGGKKVPVVGRISMDYTVLDVTDVDDAYINVGDWVALTQSPHGTLEKWALEMDTLPHEVACRFGRRVKRIYVE